jgi:hypothetical protein
MLLLAIGDESLMTVVLTAYFRFCSFWPPGGISSDGLRKQLFSA